MNHFIYMKVDTNIPNLDDLIYGAILASSVNKISGRFRKCNLERPEAGETCILAMNNSDEKFTIKRITTPEALCDDGAIYILCFGDTFEDYARARAKLEYFEHTSILVEQHKSVCNKAHVVISQKQPQIGRRYPIPHIPDVSEVNEKKEESTKKNNGNLISNIFTVLFLVLIVAAIIGMMYFCDLYNKSMEGTNGVYTNKILNETPELEELDDEKLFFSENCISGVS